MSDVFRIVSRETGEAQGVYTRANRDEYDFESVERARGANCHGIYENKKLYKINKYRVTYELIEEDL